MLHHVSIGVRDVARAAEFYDAVMAALGCKRVMEFLPHAVAYGTEHPKFWIQMPRGQQELIVANGSHIALAAVDKAAIQAFYDAALAHGGTDDGPPGPRPEYSPDYYAAFVIDPDGNRIEAVLLPKPVAKPAPAKKAAAKKVKKVKKATKTVKKVKAVPVKAVVKKAPAKKAAPKKPAKPAKVAKPAKAAKPEKKGKKGGKKGKKK